MTDLPGSSPAVQRSDVKADEPGTGQQGELATVKQVIYGTAGREIPVQPALQVRPGGYSD
jgi:hypothetical protein